MGAASFLILTAAFLLASISLSSAGYGKPGGQCYHVPEKVRTKYCVTKQVIEK